MLSWTSSRSHYLRLSSPLLLLAGRNIPTMRNKAAPRGSFYTPPHPHPPPTLICNHCSSYGGSRHQYADEPRGHTGPARQRKQRPGTNDCFNFARNNFTIYDCWCRAGLALLPLKLSDTLRVGTLRRGQSGGLLELQMKVHTKVCNHGEGP